MSESNKILQGTEPGGRKETVESAAVMKALAGKKGAEVVQAEVSRFQQTTAGWCYAYLKRTKKQTHIVAAWETWGTQDFVDQEYAYFVDLVKADSLLNAAVLTHFSEARRLTVFRDGSQVEFIF